MVIPARHVNPNDNILGQVKKTPKFEQHMISSVNSIKQNFEKQTNKQKQKRPGVLFIVRALAGIVGGQNPQRMCHHHHQANQNGGYQRLGIVQAKTLVTIVYQIPVRLEEQAHQPLTG